MTTSGQGVLAVVPARNEERRLGAVLRGLAAALPAATVVVVDDASGDATARVARARGARVVRHPCHLGYGAALQTGYRTCMAGPWDYLVQLDGDGQHDPACLPSLLAALERRRLDVVVGSRFLSPELLPPYPAPPLRRLGSRLFGLVAGLIMGQRVTDPTSGLQAMRRRAVALCLDDSYPSDYPDADTLIYLKRAGMRVGEVAVVMQPGPTRSSLHHGWRPLAYLFQMSLSILVTLLRGRPARERPR